MDCERYCVIGAGASGLTVVKNFVELGIEVECLEREDDVGGNWYYGKPASSVCHSTHLISSKLLTQYPLVHYQAQLMARFIRAQRETPRRAETFRRLKSRRDGERVGRIRYVPTPRHLLEVEHFGYQQRLMWLIEEFW